MEAINNNIQSMSSMSFQKIVIIIAIILLIITLTVIGYMMNSAVSANKIGTISKCPDKWNIKGANCVSDLGFPPYTGANAGHYLTDMSCSWVDVSNGGHSNCFGLKSGGGNASWNDVSNNWTLGNTTNGRDAAKVWLLADASYNISSSETYYYRSGNTDISHKLSYTPGSFEANQAWAQTYGITWDGLN